MKQYSLAALANRLDDIDYFNNVEDCVEQAVEFKIYDRIDLGGLQWAIKDDLAERWGGY